MKQIGFIILFVLVIYSLAAHPAYNGWEQHKLSGKVRIMAQNPQLGNPQRIYVFHPDGKISKDLFIHKHIWLGQQCPSRLLCGQRGRQDGQNMV